ncbi:MAG: major facilitator superfamily 1 [Sphingomonadales bacterium]|nr:major facilitator superfamily 1 [Sphingomonadales bacterium]
MTDPCIIHVPLSCAGDKIMTGKPATMDDRAAIVAATVLGIIAAATFMIQPGIVQALVDQAGFASKQAGYVAAAEMAGLALTTVVLSYVGHKVSWRRLIVVFALIEAGCNLASVWRQDFNGLLVLRFIAGLGAGGLTSISFGAIGETAKPDRSFGYFLMWILGYGAVGLMALPAILHLVGLSGLFAIVTGMSLVGVAIARFMPITSRLVAQATTATHGLSKGWKRATIVSSLMFSLGCGILWAFASLIGASKGVAAQSVANALGISQFFGVAGALSVGVLGARIPRPLSLTALILLGGFVALLLGFPVSGTSVIFGLLLCLFNFTWNSVQPLYLAASADFDPHGGLVRRIVAVQMSGLAVGPFLGALILRGNDFGPITASVAILMFFGAAIIIVPLVKVHRAHRPIAGMPLRVEA